MLLSILRPSESSRTLGQQAFSRTSPRGSFFAEIEVARALRFFPNLSFPNSIC